MLAEFHRFFCPHFCVVHHRVGGEVMCGMVAGIDVHISSNRTIVADGEVFPTEIAGGPDTSIGAISDMYTVGFFV